MAASFTDSPPSGLSHQQAAERLLKDGPNELSSQSRSTFIELLWKALREPMLALLLACAVFYFFVGDLNEAILLLVSGLLILGLSIYQDRKSENALFALRQLSSPRALVIRSGAKKRVPARELVVNDLILVDEGSRVPADARVLGTTALQVDESMLTGESVSVMKRTGDCVFSGTLVVGGYAQAIVTATGMRTELGKIGKMLQKAETKPTLLQQKTRSLVLVCGAAASCVCLSILVLYGLSRGSWSDGLLVALSTAISLLPEEFPVVLSIFFALGALRLAKVKVLTRSPAAIENLGAITVLCVDKTGTLTFNKMKVRELSDGSERYQVSSRAPDSGQWSELIRTAALASRSSPIEPMEVAIAEVLHDSMHKKQADLKLVKEYPLSSNLFAMTNAWEQDGQIHFATKGAPEAVLSLCGLQGKGRSQVLEKTEQMAKDGMRVLALAHATSKSFRLPNDQSQLNLQFTGLIGFEDPIRPEAVSAVRECQDAHIRLMMLTGDHRETAIYTAKQLQLKNPERSMTGSEFSICEDEFRKRVAEISIFARVRPEDKLKIVKALKARGEIVAMTGDGVNDSPSLRSSDIGIAMGQRGTDVAREAADLVLLDDNFASIVRGIRGGRTIHDNIRKSMAYVISLHIVIAGMVLVPAIAGFPLVLHPAHLVFLELIIDPACSLVFESDPEEPNVMKRPPKDPREHIFARGLLSFTLFQGAIGLAAALALFFYMHEEASFRPFAQTAVFLTLVVFNVALLIVNRSWANNPFRVLTRGNKAFWSLIVLVALVLALLFQIQSLRELFHLRTLNWGSLGLVALAIIVAVMLIEIFRMIRFKFS